MDVRHVGSATLVAIALLALTACGSDGPAPGPGADTDTSASSTPTGAAPERTGSITLDEPAPAGLAWAFEPGDGWTESTFDPEIATEYTHANGCMFVSQDIDARDGGLDPQSDRPGTEAAVQSTRATLESGAGVKLESFETTGTADVEVDGGRPVEFLVADMIGTVPGGGRWSTRYLTRAVSADASQLAVSMQCPADVVAADADFVERELATARLAAG
jgi:predicted small lipoprotein YifL